MDILNDDVLDGLQLQAFAFQNTGATNSNKRLVRLYYNRRLCCIIVGHSDLRAVAAPVVSSVDGILTCISTSVAGWSTPCLGCCAFKTYEIEGLGHEDNSWFIISQIRHEPISPGQ